MADKFCFSVKSSETNKIAVFHSDRGEDYYVKYEVNNHRDISLIVEWTIPRQVLVTAELYETDFKCISTKKDIGMEKQAFIKFCNVFKSDEVVDLTFTIIISLIPFVELKDCSALSEGQRDMLKAKSEAVNNLAEDMLIGLAMDMRNLFIRGEMCDTILTNGSSSVRVHSPVLSARSPVFQKMFKHLSTEKVITIPETSDLALEGMVMFIYSGVINIKDVNLARELYVLSNNYEIDDLREMCSLYLSDLTLDRALDTLVLAEMHKDQNLKMSAIDFVIKNLNQVKASDKWNVFSKKNLDLVSEIHSLINGDIEKNALFTFISKFVQ